MKSKILEECSDDISLFEGGEIVWKRKSRVTEKDMGRKVYIIKNVPPYFRINFRSNEDLLFKKYPSIKGFAIALENYADVNDYLRQQYKSKARSQLLRRIRRLEECFSISFKRYYGEIDEAVCNELLASLKEMIITRFQERNQVSDNLKSWAQIQNSLHKLITTKKASLFVIYNESTPISISICYHYGRVFFSYIDSYDVDYYKFGLGNILIYKKLELCFKSGYRFLDMGWGELDYKRRWCNLIYNYEHHISLPGHSLSAYLLATWEGNKTQLKAYLTSLKPYQFFKGFSSRHNSKINSSKMAQKYRFEKLENSTSYTHFVPVDIDAQENKRFKTILNDFIYTTEEHFNNIKLYRSKREEFYIIKGKNQSKRVVFNNSLKP